MKESRKKWLLYGIVAEDSPTSYWIVELLSYLAHKILLFLLNFWLTIWKLNNGTVKMLWHSFDCICLKLIQIYCNQAHV